MNYLALIANVRQRIAYGVLPAERPGRLHVQRGSGAGCSACDQPIDAECTECVIESDAPRPYRFHLACLHLWEAQIGQHSER